MYFFPYYLDLIQCMSGQSFSDNHAGFTLSGCGVSGLDGDYWITQHDGNEVWVEKNNGWAVVFSNDPIEPEFCRSSGPSNPTTSAPTTKPTANPTNPPSAPTTPDPTAAPTTSSPTNSPCISCSNNASPWMTSNGRTCDGSDSSYFANKCNKKVNWMTNSWCKLRCFEEDMAYDDEICCSATSPPTPSHTLSPTPKPTASNTLPPTPPPTPLPTPSPTPKPVASSTTCCGDRGTGYQECSTSAWCNANESQCRNCSGAWTVVPLIRNGCCSWGGGDCSSVDPSTNKGCQYLQADCEGSCGGTWNHF